MCHLVDAEMKDATSKVATSVFRGKQMYKGSEFRLMIQSLHKVLQGRLLPPTDDVLLLVGNLDKVRRILYLPALRRCTANVPIGLHSMTY